MRSRFDDSRFFRMAGWMPGFTQAAICVARAADLQYDCARKKTSARFRQLLIQQQIIVNKLDKVDHPHGIHSQR